MKYQGKVLWTSERDGNGILLVDDRIEVYFDSSVTKDFSNIKRNDILEFNVRQTGGCNCAYNVELIKTK